jgi:PEP-CTERM motif
VTEANLTISKTPFESKLARYALAGGALLGLPAAATAGVVYSGVQNLSMPLNAPLVVNFNPLVDAIPDVTFLNSTAGSGVISMMPGASNAVNLGPLFAGDPITLANTTDTVGGTLVQKNCCFSTTGPWAGQGTAPAYVGLRFTASGQDYLGWAQLSLNINNPSGTVIDWAYENTPATSINAGAVPEPSTLALFALGAAGVLALRTRRKTA